MTIDEFINFVEDKEPLAHAEKLAAIEALIGNSLPDDYRNFLVSCNGGYVGGSLWFAELNSEGEIVGAGVNHIGGSREESYYSLEGNLTCYRGRIPSDLLWIMDDPFGNAICIGLNGPYRGRLYFWDHENEPDNELWDGKVESAGNVQLLANSFTEFVAGLRPSDDASI